MTKLPKNTLDDIYFSELRTLFKENKEILWFKEYFREQVQSTLETKDEFGKEDFEEIKEDIKEKEGYVKILREIIPNYPYQLLNLLAKWKTLEEFEDFCYNSVIKTTLIFSKEKNLENFVKICKSSEEFEYFCYKKNIKDILMKSKDKNLEYVVKLCKPIEEFENICNNANARYVLVKAKEQNLEYLSELFNIQTIEEFEKIIDNDYVKRILEESNIDTLKLIIDFLDITKDNFNIFAFNTNILELSINVNSEILAYLLDLYEVKNISNLNKFAWTYSHFARNIKKWVLDDIKTFDRDLQKHVIELAWADGLNKLEGSFDFIKEHKYWVEFWFFIEFARNWVHFDIEDFPINKTNFLDFMQDDDILFEFEEVWKQFAWTKAWTKTWFMEKPERINYINSFDLYDYNTLWLIPWKLNKAISNFSTKNLDLWEDLKEFVDKKVIPSKHNTKVFIENEIPPSDNFNKLFAYYLKNKQNALVPMMEKMNFIQEFGLDIDISKFKTLDDFLDKNWNIKREELRENFEKILKINNENKQTKLLNQFDNFLYWENIKGLEKLLMDNLIKYFDYFYHKKIKIKVISSIKANLWDQNIDFEAIDNAKLDREEFIEAYKMSLNPRYNKRQINKLLFDYLTWKFDNLEDLNQYKTPSNIDWLDKNLTREQQEIWLSKNRKEITLEDENNEWENRKQNLNTNTESRINNHIEIAIKKIEELNEFWFEFETNFENKWELKKYFYTVIKKQKEEIKSKIGESNLYEDLKLQINAISKLETQNLSQNAKKSSSIIIEKELDPINSLMMWNWVDDSCLDFYDSVWNYYSSISNTIDVNKWVYYIKNENWNLLGRCLITIWSDKKLSRYKMYYSGKVDDPIDEYFDEYTKDLAKRLWLEINWDQDNVRNIESDYWYKDGTKKINY